MDKAQNAGDAWNGATKRKRFKRRYLFFVFFALCMLVDWAIAVQHPLHNGMTALQNERLCIKALFIGPYGQNLLPCLRDSAVGAGELLFFASFLVLAALLFVWRKTLYAWMMICTFIILWLGAGCANLCAFK